jgi:hypothetical protein
MAKNDDVLGRSMFAENAATSSPLIPPIMGGMTAEGTGITSGLNPEEAMSQIAAGVEQVNQGIDMAEDYEGIMNVIRGDQLSMADRRKELESYVGSADASKTPESVITLLQPTFQSMDLAEAQAQSQDNQMAMGQPNMAMGQPNMAMGQPNNMGGGITDLPLLEADSTNTAVNIQPSNQNEAMARMAMGEQPIRAYTGAAVNISDNNFTTPVPINIPFQGNYTEGPVGLQSRPDLSNVDEDVENFWKMYSQRVEGFKPDIDEALEKRMNLAQPFLTPQKTTEQYRTELQNLLGQGDSDAAATNAYLELMKYGANVANSPGNLLQALTTPAPEFAEGLQDIAANKAAQDRQIAIGAYEAEQGDIKAQRSEKLGLLNQVINETMSTERDLLSNMLAINMKSVEEGITLAKDEQKLVNAAILETYESNMTFAGKSSETWGKDLPDGTMDLKAVRYDEEGPYYIQNGAKVRPEGYQPITAATLSALSKSGGIDKTGSKPKSILIPNSTKLGGYEQVDGVWYPKVGKAFYKKFNEDTKLYEDAEMPEGSIIGKMDDVMTIKQTDDGITKISWKLGPLQGKTTLSKMRLIDEREFIPKKDKDGNIIPGTVPNENFGKTLEVDRGVNENMLEEAVFNEDGRLVSGMEYVMKGTAPAVGSFEELGKSTRIAINERIINTTKAVDGLEQLMFLANKGHLSGVLTQLGQFTTGLQKWNAMSSANDFWRNGFEYLKTTEAQQLLNLVRKDLQMAAALSTRFNQKEQDIIASWLEGGFKNPESMKKEIGVLYYKLRNDLDQSVALAENRAPMVLLRPPEGTNKDPWKLDNRRDRSYTQRITNTGGKDALSGQHWSASGFYLYETYKNTNIIPPKILKKYQDNPDELFTGKFP